MYKFFPAAIFLMLTSTMSFGQNFPDSQLQKGIDQLLFEKFPQNGPGVAVLVARSGAITYEKAIGNADLELKVSLRPQMLFDLGSITKQFTAVAILQLMEKGKLALTDSLQKYIPGYPSKGYTITIENLLTHTSGMPDYMQMGYKGPFLQRRDFTPKELIDLFKNEPLEFEPGTQFKYSNSGYYLLGYIIQVITGEKYERYIRENILEPLSLTHTFYKEPNAIIPDHVHGYKKETANYENADFWSPTIAYSAGGLASNPEDLFKWHQGLYAYKILKKETLERAFMPYILKNGTATGYGYGWYIATTNGIKSIGHGGAITGFLTNETYYPKEDVYIVILCNCDCAPMTDLPATIASVALGKPMQADRRITDSILNSYTGTYTMISDAKRTIVISREKDHLIANVSGQGTFLLIFQSEKNFSFKGILDLNCEFVRKNDKVTMFIAHQNGQYVWEKTK